MRITLDVPEQCLLMDSDTAQLARRIQLYAAILMFQAGELSAGAATEFAGVNRFTFLAECQRHGIATVSYPAGELAEEAAPP